mgnify:CR=1 FL=1
MNSDSGYAKTAVVTFALPDAEQPYIATAPLALREKILDLALYSHKIFNHMPGPLLPSFLQRAYGLRLQFPESLLSFADIEMHTIAPLISDISDGVRSLSDEQRSTDIDKILHALDALADYHIWRN